MNRISPEASVEDSPIALLYDCYAHRILTYLSRFALSEEDADDLVLEVFIAAMEKPVWITWSDGEQLAWLHRIAHNKAVDHFRRAKRHPSISLDHVAPLLYEDEGHAPEARAVRNEDATQLRTHLSDLSDLQQEQQDQPLPSAPGVTNLPGVTSARLVHDLRDLEQRDARRLARIRERLAEHATTTMTLQDVQAADHPLLTQNRDEQRGHANSNGEYRFS
jgi:RNA polymerase sigma-70 factor (ECF subfamily)